MCSIDTNSSLILLAIIDALLRVLRASRESIILVPDTFAKLSKSLSNVVLILSKLIFVFLNKKGITFLSISVIDLKTCSFSI